MSDKQRVLLVGGSGFIGTHLARALLERGFDVTIHDTLLHMELEENDGRYEYFKALYRARKEYLFDFLDDALHYTRVNDPLRATIKKGNFDYVVHMGDYSSQRMGSKYPEHIVRTTVDNALAIRDCAPHVRKRTIYFSSSMVYGDFESFAHEDQILKPIGHYGIARLAGEQIIKTAIRDLTVDAVIVRPSAVFGPYDSDDRVIGQFILAALNNENLKVNGAGMILDFTPVHVVVNKVIALMEAENLTRRVYNVTMSDRSLKAMSLETAATSVLLSTPGTASKIEVRENEAGWPKRGLLSRALFEADIGKVEMNINLTESLFGACLWRKEFRERTGF